MDGFQRQREIRGDLCWGPCIFSQSLPEERSRGNPTILNKKL